MSRRNQNAKKQQAHQPKLKGDSYSSKIECTHIEATFVNLQSCQKFFKDQKGKNFACKECTSMNDKKKKKNLVKPNTQGDYYICLQCGVVFCEQHQRDHATSMKKHSLATHVKFFKLCCFSCDIKSGLNYENNKVISQCMDAVQGKEVIIQAAPDKQVVVPTKNINYNAPKGNKGKQQMPVIVGIKGLENLGNTCFFNSIIQNILQTKPLLHIFAPEALAKTDIIKSGNKPIEGPLISEMRNLFQEYWSIGRTPCNRQNPRPLFMQIVKRARQFGTFRQQDAQELLRVLLELLITEEGKTLKQIQQAKGTFELQYATEIERIINKNTGIEVQTPQTPEEEDQFLKKLESTEDSKAGIPDENPEDEFGSPALTTISKNLERIAEYEQNYKKCSIESIFQGNFVSTVQCHSCGIQSHVYESFCDISLSVPFKFLPQKQRDAILGPRRNEKKNQTQNRFQPTPGQPSKKALKKAAREKALQEQQALETRDQESEEENEKKEGEEQKEDKKEAVENKEENKENVDVQKENDTPNQAQIQEGSTAPESKPEVESSDVDSTVHQTQSEVTATVEEKKESQHQHPDPELQLEPSPSVQEPSPSIPEPQVITTEQNQPEVQESQPKPAEAPETSEAQEGAESKPEDGPKPEEEEALATPLSAMEGESQSYLTPEEEIDPEVLNEQEMKKKIASYQDELLKLVTANVSQSPNSPLIQNNVPISSSNLRCSIDDCFRQFIEPEDLSLEEGNGVDCYPCTRQAFNKAGLPVDYLIEHYGQPEIDLQQQVELLQADGQQVNEFFYSVPKVESDDLIFPINRTIKPKLVKRTARKQIMLEKFPEILTIHFKRFVLTAYDIQKIVIPIDFPLELDLTAYAKKKLGASEDISYVYSLFGVCNHSGGFGSGHYTAFTKVNSKEGAPRWFYFSDTQYHEVDVKEVLNSAAYLLFYQRVPNK